MTGTAKAIKRSERLGREVFSSKQAKRTRRKATPHYLFEHPSRQLSADRLDLAPIADLTAIADANGTKREKNFYGWAFIRAEVALDRDMTVQATPLEDNPYHADITFPERDPNEAKDVDRERAIDLASHAEWQERATVATDPQ